MFHTLELKAAVARLTEDADIATEFEKSFTSLSDSEKSQLERHLGHFDAMDVFAEVQGPFSEYLKERREAERAIQQKRDQNPGFGDPTTNLQSGAHSRGYVRHFQRGSIFWLRTFGAHYVHGAIRDKYASLGWDGSYLGHPITDELSNGGLRYNNFENGTIHWTATAGAYIPPALRVRIERHNLGAWVHISGQGFTSGGIVRFSVRGLNGFTGDKSIGVLAFPIADGTFPNVIWDGRTWSAGGNAQLVAFDQSSGRSVTAPIPALH